MAPPMLKAALAVLPSLALAAPSSRYGSSNSDDLACAPSVDLSNGTYHGVSNEHYNQEFFLGIPYAQPPTGSLRFAPPQHIDESWDEPRDATKYGNICYGYGADTAALSNPISEDCLTLNIVRPAGTQPGDDLPVAIWVHGGSYTNGASADPRYNLTYIVDQSVKENKPFVAVSINYRLSYWGFLFSEEMEAAGAGNIAFKDQRLAFKWIQDNVAAFGGSADKVTVWGESAGARSLGMQLVAYDGQHDGLFHGAILESGSPVTKFVDAAAWQPYFDAVVEKTGCSDSADHLECLRELPAKTLNDVFNNTTPVKVTPPSLSAVLDGDFMTAQAQELLAAGKFAHVPLLLGNNFDEGTAYGKKGLNTSEQFVSYLSTLNLTDAQVDQIATLYPDDPDVGIPASYVGRPTDPSYGPQWKRAAAFAGDWQQHAGRRALAESYAQADLSVYSYLWNVYVNGISNILGATHFQEVAFVFYDLTSSEFKNKPETFKELSNLMSRQWVNFINDANPNLSVSPNEDTPAWPLYTPAQPDNLVFDVNVTGLAYTAEDNYRAEAITYLQENVYE